MQPVGYVLQILGLVTVPTAFFYSEIRYGELTMLAIGASAFLLGTYLVRGKEAP